MLISQQTTTKITLCIIVITIAITISNSCEEFDWTCGNGECIAAEKFCDGITDCSDDSDEIEDNCNQEMCPPFSFRCAYGMCIMDESDEARLLCNNEDPVGSTTCIKDKFQCASGHCISLDDACDGRADCADGSDETVQDCASISCSSMFFRCGYGACIRADKKCNGVKDCVDGSDEAVSLCENNKITKKFSKTPITKKISDRKPKLGNCIVPNIPHLKMVYQSNRKMKIEADAEVPTGTEVAYNCSYNFHREGSNINICLKGEWFKEHPICTRYCPSERLESATFKAICKNDGRTYDCNHRIKPGMIAEINCLTKYEVPPGSIQTLLCSEEGEWDHTPKRCEQSCGEELKSSRPLVAYGQSTDITTVPWHVAVYKKKITRFEQSCGGSLLNAKVVLSAAHCFWDEANSITYDKSAYQIVAGKFFRDYDTKEAVESQKQNIAEILIPNEYQGKGGNFKADIALLVLVNAMKFSEFVSPICIQWMKNNEKSIRNDVDGQVAGWGEDEHGKYSNELRTITLRPSSYEYCKEEANVPDDMFCVPNTYRTNPCAGDSGGGFTVKKDGRTYLWGVVSNGMPYGKRCTSIRFSTFTNIQHHELFIRDHEAKNRPR